MAVLTDGFKLECAFASGPFDVSPTWTDITAYWVLAQSTDINRGRGSEQDAVSTGTLGLTLDNTDGRFTVGNTSSPYYPNVKLRKQIRITYREQLTTRTNLGTNPRAVTASGWTTNDPTKWTSVTNQAAPGSHPGGVTTAAKVTVAAGGAGGTILASLFDLDALGNSGTTRGFGVWVYAPVAANVQCYLAGNQAGTTLTTAAAANTWTWCPTAAASTGYAVAIVSRQTGTVSAGDITYLTASISEAATVPTSEFDGGTPDANGYDYAWTGTANASTSTATPIVYPIFKGYVDEWPVAWPDGGELYAWAQVRASDRFKPLGTPRTLRSVPEEELLLNAPQVYYPLGEPDGSTRVADIAGGSRTATPFTVGTAGTLTFAQGTGPGTDGLSCPTWVSTATDGIALLDPGTVGTTAGLSVEFCFSTTTPVGTNTSAVHVGKFGSGVGLAIQITSSGSAVSGIALSDSTTNQSSTNFSNVAYTDGGVHHCAVTVTPNVAGATARMYMDGVLKGTITTSGSLTDFLSANLPTFTGVTIGGGYNYLASIFYPWIGSLSHVAIYGTVLDATAIARHSDAMRTGFANESTGARVARVADWGGVATGDRVIDTGNTASVRHVDTTGKTAQGYMQELADTEGGLVFIDTAGKLQFQARGDRINTTAALTLSAASQQVSPDVQYRSNDQFLLNDVTYNRDGGLTYRATDATSVTDYGPYAASRETYTTSDNEVRDHATWVVYTSKTPTARIEGLGIDMLTDSASRVAALSLDLSSKVAVTNMPAAAPGATANVFVEGYRESISLTDWTRSLNTSPADAYSPLWQLGLAGFGELGQTTTLNF